MLLKYLSQSIAVIGNATHGKEKTMALNWSLDKIRDFDTVCVEPRGVDGAKVLSSVTETLIWATMATNINAITEKNADEFYARLSLWERLNGSLRRNPDLTDRPTTIEEVRAHIGLGTNATNMTRARWLKSIGERYLTSAARNYRNAGIEQPIL